MLRAGDHGRSAAGKPRFAFVAWLDEPWIIEGAAVRISIVGFDAGIEETRTLNGSSVETINSDLTAVVDVTSALPFRENLGISFEGSKKTGPFDIGADLAAEWLALPINMNGKRNLTYCVQM